MTEPTTQREAILQTLSAHKQELSAKYGVTRLGIFGSVAREEASSASDVDIVVEMPPDLFKMVHMKEDLEEILAAPVDFMKGWSSIKDRALMLTDDQPSAKLHASFTLSRLTRSSNHRYNFAQSYKRIGDQQAVLGQLDDVNG